MSSRTPDIAKNAAVLQYLQVPRSHKVAEDIPFARSSLLSDSSALGNLDPEKHLKRTVLFTLLSSENPNPTLEYGTRIKEFERKGNESSWVRGGPILVGCDPFSGTVAIPYMYSFVPGNSKLHQVELKTAPEILKDGRAIRNARESKSRQRLMD